MDQSLPMEDCEQASIRMDSSSHHHQLSDTQQIVLNILPIPSAIVSILGSSAIIYLARKRLKRGQKCTPYTRLLAAVSICDILFSTTIGIATFLRPSDTSFRIWAFGNDATCRFVAFMNQLSTAGGIWYNGMLSFYFLLTARYGMKNSRISRRIEPLMHLFAVGYAISTSIAGATVDIYGEKAGAMACWTSRYNNDSDGGKIKESDIRHDIVGLSFFAVPMLIVFICLVINNVIIYRFVRRHTRKLSSQQSDESTSSSKGIFGNSGRNTDPLESSGPSVLSAVSSDTAKAHSIPQPKSKRLRPVKRLSNQSQRLQLVFSQSLLFVLSFLVCHFWNVIMGVLPSGARDQGGEMEILAKHYAWAVLQATFLPMQGLFNMIIFLRPKYLVLRLEFPNEGQLWTVKRLFQGDQLQPTVPNRGVIAADIAVSRQHQTYSDADAPVGDTNKLKSDLTPDRVARHMMSSITASDGDFDSAVCDFGDDERWHDASSRVSQGTPSDLASGVNRVTTLEAISELSESVFDFTPYQANGSHLFAASDAASIPSELSESRWKGTETSASSTTTLGSLSAENTGTSDQGDAKRRLGTDSRPEVPRRMSNSSNRSMKAPKRTVDTAKLSDVPIRLPIRTSDAPKEPALLGSERQPNLKLGQSANRVCDVPLTLPERVISTASEIEDA